MTRTAKKTKTANRTLVRKRGTPTPKPTTKPRKARSAPMPVVIEEPVAPKKNGSVVLQCYKAKAGRGGVLCHDALGAALTDAFLGEKTPRDACDAILAENGLDVGRWAGKNPGQLRMNLGNVLRARVRNGFEVHVRGKSFA